MRRHALEGRQAHADRHLRREPVLCTQAPHDGLAESAYLRVRLGPTHAGTNARDDGVVVAAALALRGGAQRSPDIGRNIAAEFGRHYADDDMTLAPQHDGAAEYGGVGAEGPFPERIAEDGDVGAARAVLIRRELAAEKGFHSERLEKTCTDALHPNVLGAAAEREVRAGAP